MSGGPLETNRQARFWRVGILCAVFLLQFELVEASLRAYYERDSGLSSIWAPFFNFRHFFFGFAIVFPATLALIVWPRVQRHIAELKAATQTYHWLPRLALQLACYTGFALLTFSLSVHPGVFAGFTNVALLAWALLLGATAGSSMLALAPVRYWRHVCGEEKISIFLAAVTALLATGFSLWLQGVTSTLAFGTLQGSYYLLGLFFDAPVLDLPERIIGTGNFVVHISNDCAGYEGIALIAVFLGVYLWVFRRDFRFPWVLLAFPIGFIAVFAFNLVRVATLIAIGDAGLPDVAITGFHSNAGWIAFLAVFVGLVWLLHTAPLFARPGLSTGDPKGMGQTGGQAPVVDALLVPLAVLLASMLLLGAFSTDFDRLYPVKVIATGAALWAFRGRYSFSQYPISLFPVALGATVFVLWLLLVPHSAEQSVIYAARFSQWPVAVTIVWLAFRVIGAVVTVPLAEELAFRGYLLARLAGRSPAVNSQLDFNVFALVTSSLLFGLMHGDWVAGTLAGMAYAWARYRRGLMGDAVIAHMTTNLLLCVYILGTGHWGYW